VHQFAGIAKEQCEVLEGMHKRMIASYQQMAKYFCFDPKKYAMDEFFGDIKTFIDAFAVCILSLLSENWSLFGVTDYKFHSLFFFSNTNLKVAKHIEGGPKKRGTLLLSTSLPVIDRFSIFFHWRILQTICNNAIITYSTTP